jgi:hypothetical protein
MSQDETVKSKQSLFKGQEDGLLIKADRNC